MATWSSPPTVYGRGLAGGLSTIVALLGSFMKLAVVFAENKTSASFDDLWEGGSSNFSSGTTAASTNTTEDAPYVAPHPIWVTIIIGILAGIVMILTVLGNITVLLAFGLERTIRQPTNYFLASLAVSDLMIGTFSMPLYTQYILYGKWRLGPWLCDLWLSLDWTACLTSQYTVFLITMDRYLSVKIPAKYRNWRTEKKVLIMISVTWVLPTLVFFTSIIGWQFFVGKRTVAKWTCEVQFMNDAMFTFLLTIGYFWITLFVIGVLYFGIYKVALDLQKKSDAKHKKMQSTMELAGDGPNHHDRHTASAIAEGNNSGDSGSKQGKSGGKANNRKSVRAALPCPLGVPAVNTTSFSTNKAEKDDDRSSSPAFASDDENSSSGGATGVPKSPMPSGVYIGRPNPAAGIVNSALFANTGGLVRSLHGDLFFGGAVDKGESQSLLPAPPSYSEIMDGKGAGGAGVEGTEAAGNINGARRNDAEDTMYSSASDRLEKQTTPLLQEEINKGSKYIDEKSFMANLNSENIALLPDLSKNASQIGDDDVNDVQTASSPIWKRRHSLPPVSSDTYDIDDEVSEIMMGDPTTTITSVNNTPVASRHHGNGEEGDTERLFTTDGPRRSDDLLGNENDDKNNRENGKYDATRPSGDAGCVGFGGAGETETTTAAANNVASSTAPDQSSNLNNNNSVNNATTFNNNNTTTITTTTAVPSDTNEEESSRSDTHCLSAAHRRRNKDTRLHTFVKSVRSRNSRRRNRRERKSKSENRARKALRTITIILGAFIVCWTPYHICVMVMAICKDCLNDYVYMFTYWMCYLNSPINPFCYAFANTQFKRTFLRIMKFDWHRT